MKRIIPNIKAGAAASAILVAAVLASCSDVVTYPDELVDPFANFGPPSISTIYDVQDTARIEALSGGSLNQMIRISGQNLSKVKSISFNNIEVNLKDVYATTYESFVKIPRQLPDNINNKLVYTTEAGSVTIDFEVGIPTLQLDGLFNEFAPAGSSVQVCGDFFDLFGFGQPEGGASVRIGSTELTVDSISESYMSVLIPEGTPDNSLLTFSWTEPGGKQMTRDIPYRYSKYMLFDDLAKVGWWSSKVSGWITDGSHDGDPLPLAGNYFRFKGHYDQWSWNDCGGGSNWPDIDCRANTADYVLKFEVCNAASYPFYDSADYGYLFSLNDGDNTPWNPSAGMSFNTYGRWQTVEIPLDRVASKGVPGPGEWSNFCLIFQPNTDGGWNIDHCFANFRIEPKKF